MKKDANTLAFLDFILAFDTWSYDRQTRAIESFRTLDPEVPQFAEIAEIMAEIRDGKRSKAKAA